MITSVAVYNYRSLRDFVVPLQALNIITGPNGSGKSNVYRALRLLADIAQGRIWSGEILRPATLLVERRNALVRSRGEKGEWATLTQETRQL